MMDMTSTTTPTFTCPDCGYVMDMASPAVGNATPKPGDLSLCMRCTAVLQFGDGLTQRALTPEEFLDLPIEVRQKLLWLRDQINAFWKQRSKEKAAS